MSTQPVIIPEVQIDFGSVHDAKVMENYAKTELGLTAVVSENPIMVSIFDVPESSLSKIRRRCAVEDFSKGTVKVINQTRDAIVGAADFAAYRVVAPVAQAGIKATAGIAKVAAKATLATGATLVGSTIENTRRTAQELKTDPEVIHAKAELKGAFGAIKGFFGFTGSTEGIRIVTDNK